MRILRVIGSMNPVIGGPCQGIRNSITELAKSGVYNEVVSLDDPGEEFLGQDSFIIHALGPNARPWAYSAKLAPWLTENLPRFDVVIVHGLWLYHSYAVWKAIRKINEKLDGGRPKIRFFIMPHGMLDPWFQDAAGRRLKAIRNWLYWKAIEHRVVNEADGLLFTCETELLLARKPFSPYKPKLEINVSYGIQAPPDYQDSMREAFLAKCPDVHNQPYLLFLSRIHYKKGVDMLINAYALLAMERSTLSNSLPKLVIAGPGLETEYGQKMVALVASNAQLKGQVFFTGMLTDDAKWGALYGCEAFVLPSHQENFGIAVAEALACGKPVLISNQVNIWREIEAGGGGFIAENSIEGIRELFSLWLSISLESRIIMEEKAKDTFEQHFAIEQTARQFKESIA